MKKTWLLLTPLVVCVFYFACRKAGNNEYPTVTDPFANAAIQWAKKEMPAADFESLDLTSIKTLKNGETTIVAQIFTRNPSDKGYVIIAKDSSSGFIGNWVNWQPVNLSASNGTLITETFDGNLKNEVTMTNGYARKISRTVDGETQNIVINYPSTNAIGSTSSVSVNQIGMTPMGGDTPPSGGGGNLPPFTMIGYLPPVAGPSDADFTSLFWSLNQNSLYYNSYSYPATSGGGGSAPTSAGTASIATELNNNEPAVPLADLLTCFDNVPSTGASYSMKLLVDIPVNGDPSAYFDWHFSPGHTYIELTKSNGSQSVTQDIGFYPNHGFSALTNMPVASKTVDNSADTHEYNASLSISGLTASQFATVTATMTTDANKQYTLLSVNCTSFALDAVNSIRTTPIQCVPMVIMITDPVVGPLILGNSIYTPQGLYQTLQSMQASNPGSTNIVTNTVAHTTAGKGICL